MPNILLVTVTKVESQSVLDLFPLATGEKWKRVYMNTKPYYILGKLGGVDIFMVQCEMGAVGPGAALITVIKAIQDIGPIAVIMVGIAFGINPDAQQLGDILVSRQIRSYEQQKVKGRKLIPRGDRVMSSPRLISLFRDGDFDWTGAKVHFGLILSGEKLVMSRAFREQLLQLEPEAIGGEMEGAGVYTAASDAKVDWILVKAICDWADESKNYDSQPIAANNAVSFLIHVLGHGGLSDYSNGIAGNQSDHKISSSVTQPAARSFDTSSNHGKATNAYSVINNKNNPNNPSLLEVADETISNTTSFQSFILLQSSTTYWGRAIDRIQLEKYIIQKKLATSSVDIVLLPPLKSAKGNVSPSAWMKIHEEFCYIYSGWGNRHTGEKITILRNNEKIQLSNSQPIKLFGFETIYFEGEPTIKQIYIHPVQKISFKPDIEKIILLQSYGLWVSAGYAWLNIGNNQLAMKAFNIALSGGLEDKVAQQVLISMDLLEKDL